MDSSLINSMDQSLNFLHEITLHKNINTGDQIIFSYIFPIPFTILRHAIWKILITLTHSLPTNPIKDCTFSLESCTWKPHERSLSADLFNIFFMHPSTNLQSQGKMKFYILFSLAGIIFHSSECIEIKLELQRNILNFGYGINYKYERILAHLFDRFYVVTKFVFSMVGDIKVSKLTFDDTCAYMEKEYAPNTDSRKY